MGLLLALVLSQLVPQRPTPLLPPPPPCSWGPRDGARVPVWCESGCSCPEVIARLEHARVEITANWSDAPADWWAGLKGWRIYVSQKQYIPGPNNEKLYGVTLSDEKRVVLSWDMCGALHELVHVQEIAAGTGADRTDMFDHPLWTRNSAIREISDRYRQLFRNRPP